MDIKVIIKKGDVALIQRKGNEYAVVRGLDECKAEWDSTINYWGYGKLWNRDEAEALARALDVFRQKTEEFHILRIRLEEIASKAIDGLYEDDPEQAREYLLNEVDMDEDEMEYFGKAE